MQQNVNTREVRLSNTAVIRFKDACAEAGVHPHTMRRYIASGRGPRLVRLSERVHGIRRNDLDAWIESRAAPE